MGGFLLLPFVLGGLHAAPSTIGIGLALVFAGGAFGKFVCGWVGARLGLVGTIDATEGMTASMILAVPFLPLPGLLALLPQLGGALNGTSTVLGPCRRPRAATSACLRAVLHRPASSPSP